jgi:hypothetical protein
MLVKLTPRLEQKYRNLLKHRAERGLLQASHVVVNIPLKATDDLGITKPVAGQSPGRLDAEFEPKIFTLSYKKGSVWLLKESR